MKATATLFNLSFFFFVPVAIVYALWTRYSMGAIEPVGAIALPLLGVMGLMIGIYLRSTMKRLDLDPADNPRGDQHEQAGEYGFFSPHTWWPLPLALSATLLFLGLALGLWVFLVGLVLGVLSLIGWTFEYFHTDMEF